MCRDADHVPPCHRCLEQGAGQRHMRCIGASHAEGMLGLRQNGLVFVDPVHINIGGLAVPK